MESQMISYPNRISKFISKGIKRRFSEVADDPKAPLSYNLDEWMAKDQTQKVTYTRIEAGNLVTLSVDEQEGLGIRMKTVPDEIDSLRSHGVRASMVDCLKKNFGFSKLTQVQKHAIPMGLAGLSFLASSPTGSGKTLAFLVPLAHRLRASWKHKRSCKALILAPTRELAQQM